MPSPKSKPEPKSLVEEVQAPVRSNSIQVKVSIDFPDQKGESYNISLPATGSLLSSQRTPDFIMHLMKVGLQQVFGGRVK